MFRNILIVPHRPLTSGPGSSPWMVHHGAPPSVLSEAAAAPERHCNVPSYCPSLTKSTPGTWNLECWPAENVWKKQEKKKWIRKTSQSVKVRTGKRLTHAARSCSCSDPGHSQPWWSQSGLTAAPKDIWRSFSVESPQTVSEERKTVSDLLMVRILNQLLSVFQFSYEIVLRGNIKQIRTSEELHPISPLQEQMICFLSYFTTFEAVPNTEFQYFPNHSLLLFYLSPQRWEISKRREKRKCTWTGVLCSSDMFLWITLWDKSASQSSEEAQLMLSYWLWGCDPVVLCFSPALLFHYLQPNVLDSCTVPDLLNQHIHL